MQLHYGVIFIFETSEGMVYFYQEIKGGYFWKMSCFEDNWKKSLWVTLGCLRTLSIGDLTREGREWNSMYWFPGKINEHLSLVLQDIPPQIWRVFILKQDIEKHFPFHLYMRILVQGFPFLLQVLLMSQTAEAGGVSLSKPLILWCFSFLSCMKRP